MVTGKDNPGVYLPPPLLLIAAFLCATGLQRLMPLNTRFFHSPAAAVIGTVVMFAALGMAFPALRQFFQTKNTVATMRAATSLQTNGIYAISRNPMYISLLLFYTGISFTAGSWWHFLLAPVLFFAIQEYVIKKEEKYLSRKFGQSYMNYKQTVRRWL